MTVHVSRTGIEPLQTFASQAFSIVLCHHQLNSCVWHNCTLKYE